MADQVTTLQLSELMQDGADVLTTVMDFGIAEIKRSNRADLSLLTVSGIYSHKLGKEIEKIAIQCRGNLGLEFRDMKANPAFRQKFDSSAVVILNSIRARYRKRNKQFLICMPPSELVDVLRLAGVYHTFQIVEQPGQDAVGPSGRSTSSGADTVAPPPASEEIRRKITHLNQSLKRTASLEKGMDSAEKCVKRFLPQAPPVVPGYSFSFSCQSSEKVGGDLFDFIPLGDEHLGISIGDVSGHGIDAALLMGISKKVIRIRALDAGPRASPKKVLEQANVDLVTEFTRSTFVTVLYAILHLPTGEFTYARAGHEPPYRCGPDRGNVVVQDTKGLPLAVDSGRLFNRVLNEQTLQVPPGAFVFLCTDGLAECWNPKGSTYSKERLIFSLEQLDQTQDCQMALDSILKAIRDFAAGRPQEDDMTAILVKREPDGTI